MRKPLDRLIRSNAQSSKEVFMQNGYVTFLALLALSILSVSCGDAAGKKVSDSNSKTTQFLEATKTNLTNISQTLDNQNFVASCDATGIPDSSTLSTTYNNDAFPCALGTDTKNFNSPLGIMSVASGIMCAVEDIVDFNYSTSTTTHTVTISGTDPCLNGVSLGIAASYQLTVKEEALLNNSSWTYKISIDFPASGTYSNKRMYIYLRDASTTKAIKVGLGTRTGNSDNSDFLGLILDQNNTAKIIRMDMVSNLRHYRTYIQSPSSDYSGISTFYGAHSVTSGGGVLSYYASAVTYQFKATSGSTCSSNPNCDLAEDPGLGFSTLSAGNLATFSNRLTSSSDGVLTFTTSVPNNFSP